MVEYLASYSEKQEEIVHAVRAKRKLTRKVLPNLLSVQEGNVLSMPNVPLKFLGFRCSTRISKGSAENRPERYQLPSSRD